MGNNGFVTFIAVNGCRGIDNSGGSAAESFITGTSFRRWGELGRR
jgi:hypothetical protein